MRSMLPDLAVTGEAPPNENLTLGYTLIGIGVALLLGVVGYWWWSKRTVPWPSSSNTAGPAPKEEGSGSQTSQGDN